MGKPADLLPLRGKDPPATFKTKFSYCAIPKPEMVPRAPVTLNSRPGRDEFPLGLAENALVVG